MKKYLVLLLPAVLIVSGCTLPTSGGRNSGGQTGGGVMKSQDGGKNWELKVKAGETQTIGGVDVISMGFDNLNSGTIFVGTKENGIFTTRDGGENWEKLNYPPTKVYGLALNPQNTQEIYASGVWQNRGKIYKSTDAGKNWKEIYTEPGDGTVIISMAISRSNPKVLLAGNNNGVIIKSTDGGEQWKGLLNAGGPVTRIVYDAVDDNVVYFVVSNKGLLRSGDGGESGTVVAVKPSQDFRNVAFEDNPKSLPDDSTATDQTPTPNRNNSPVQAPSNPALRATGGSQTIFTVAVDPSKSGVVYAGTKSGIFVSNNFGETWAEVPLIGSSKNFPVVAIAINPANSREIVYSVAQAVYKSMDGGETWSTFQMDIGRGVQLIKYDPLNASNIYIGLNKAPY